MTTDDRVHDTDYHRGYRAAVANFGSVFVKGFLSGALAALLATARWWT